jgi:hypothetical protein
VLVAYFPPRVISAVDGRTALASYLEAGSPRVSWSLWLLGRLSLATSRKQHPAELRERAVTRVFELRAESGSARGSLARVGEKLGINPEMPPREAA